MKRILYIHHGGSDGGAPRSLLYLIQKIDRTQYDVYLLCKDTEGHKKLFESLNVHMIYSNEYAAFHGSTVVPVSLRGIYYNCRNVLPTYSTIQKVIQEVQPDIVHLNSTCLFVAAKAIKDVSPKTMVVCHVREPLRNNFLGDILRRYNKKYVDRFVAIDKFDAASLKFEPKYLKIIYNFVDFTVYNSSVQSTVLRDSYGIPENKTVFLYLARVAESNGALEMLTELKRHKDEAHNMHFVVAGFKNETEYETKVKALADTIPFATLIPFVQNVPEVIAAADVMVCPFIEPHFARAIIEAGAMGKPSVASDIGGPQELVVPGETGLLFNPHDFGEFWDLCKKLDNEKAYRLELGRNAEVYTHQYFDADRNAKETFSIYVEDQEQKNE